MTAQTVKQFVVDAYQLVSANSPTVPLYGDDQSKAVQFLNELMQDYSSSGLLTPIAQFANFLVAIGQEFITFGAPDYLPTPNITLGRLSNCQNAWLDLEGVTYPLIIESRNVFFSSYKYNPQVGLPRFAIIVNNTNLTTMRLYPAPSEVFNVNIYGKFEPLPLTLNSDMSTFPNYQLRFLKLALGKELAFYKGRSSAWDEKLEAKLDKAEKDIASASSVNLAIDSSNESYLNGSWRVKAGI